MKDFSKYSPVFIGSTLTDLEKHRESVWKVFTELRVVFNGMELFGATPDRPIETCLESVRKSKFYIGIFGDRYGSIPAGECKSFTHLEYEEAQKLSLPTLIYHMHEGYTSALVQQSREHEIALAKLKDEHRRIHTMTPGGIELKTPEQLALRVLVDYLKFSEKQPGGGLVLSISDFHVNTPNVHQRELGREVRYSAMFSIYNLTDEPHAAIEISFATGLDNEQKQKIPIWRKPEETPATFSLNAGSDKELRWNAIIQAGIELKKGDKSQTCTRIRISSNKLKTPVVYYLYIGPFFLRNEPIPHPGLPLPDASDGWIFPAGFYYPDGANYANKNYIGVRIRLSDTTIIEEPGGIA